MIINITQQNKICAEKDERIIHIKKEYSKLAQMEYKTKHDLARKAIHKELCKRLRFDEADTYMHEPDYVRKWDTFHYLIRDAFNKFSDFFVHAFKIIVDSWKFSMLLLYIIWDDWLILMISASNEQLQQELKPDCHYRWISKMQSRRQETLEEPYAILF